jgi:hypothetical protein
MAVQEDHDLADDLLLGPSSNDAARPYRPDGIHFPQVVGFRLDNIEHLLPEGAQELLGVRRADTAIMPDARYFSMPSTDVGAEVLRKRALNCCPWVRSLTQSPAAVIHSPAEMMAA